MIRPYSPEYYQANDGQILRLSQGIDRLIDESLERTSISILSLDEEPVLIDEDFVIQQAAEENIESGHEPEVAHELANAWAQEATTIASIEARSALAQTSRLWFASAPAAEKAERLEDSSPLLPFDTISWSRSDYQTEDEDIELTRMSLIIPKIGQVLTYKVAIVDDLIQQKLDITRFPDSFMTVSLRQFPVKDKLIERSVSVFDLKEETLAILSGDFQDEEQLNAMITELWNGRDNKYKEDVAKELLLELHERAVAAKKSIELNAQHGTSLPNMGELSKIREFLGI